MGVKFSKRFIAYIIDMLFVISIVMMINYFFKNDTITLESDKKINQLNESFIKSQVDFEEYINEYSIYTYNIDKNNVICLIINIIIMIFYFIVVPKWTNGYTAGKFIMKIKIKDQNKKVSFKTLIIRSGMMNGLFFMIASLLFVFILKNQNYFIMLTILGFLQILLVIISGFMIIYRQDLKGLQDLFSKSTVCMR